MIGGHCLRCQGTARYSEKCDFHEVCFATCVLSTSVGMSCWLAICWQKRMAQITADVAQPLHFTEAAVRLRYLPGRARHIRHS